MTAASPLRLPMHLAFYWLGVAEERTEGITLRGEVGPYVEALADAFDRVTVLAYEAPPQVASPEDVADYLIRPAHRNVHVLSLGPKGSWRNAVRRRRRVRAIVRRASLDWDVLLLRFDRRAHLVFAANRSPRTIAMVHGHSGAVVEPAPPITERIRMAPFGLRSGWHLRRVVRGSGLFVTDGEKYLSAYGSHAHASVLIRHSIRREKWSHHVPDRLDGPTPRFLFVGRTSSRKGILETLEAFAEIRARLLPTARLDVVGSGPELAAARELTARRGITEAVTFHGTVAPGERLSALYRDADVLLFLSRSESFPKVVLEAMAHSVLVVGTPVGSLPVAFEDGREMMFVQALPSSVVAAVRALLQNPEVRRAMIERGQRVAKETSVEQVVRELADATVRRWPDLASRAEGDERTRMRSDLE